MKTVTLKLFFLSGETEATAVLLAPVEGETRRSRSRRRERFPGFSGPAPAGFAPGRGRSAAEGPRAGKALAPAAVRSRGRAGAAGARGPPRAVPRPRCAGAGGQPGLARPLTRSRRASRGGGDASLRGWGLPGQRPGASASEGATCAQGPTPDASSCQLRPMNVGEKLRGTWGGGRTADGVQPGGTRRGGSFPGLATSQGCGCGAGRDPVGTRLRADPAAGAKPDPLRRACRSSRMAAARLLRTG